MTADNNADQRPRKILVLSANPLDKATLRLDEEVREIREALRRSKHREHFEVVSHGAVRLKDLRRALLDERPQFVHFCGHGAAEGLALEDESGGSQLVSGAALSDLFSAFKGEIRCVVLNACSTETQAEAISEHVRYVIGSPRDLGDRAAIAFAVGFYDALGAGRDIKAAHQLGGSAVKGPDVPEGLAPVIKENEALRSPDASARGGRARHVRWLALAFVLLVVTFLLVLSALGPQRTAIDARLKVSRVCFIVTDPKVASLLNSVDAEYVTLSRFDRVTFEGGRLEFTSEIDAQSREPTGWRAAGPAGEIADVSLVAAAAASNLTLEKVTLNRADIEPGAQVILDWSEEERNSLRMELNKAASGTVSTVGPLSFSCTGCKVEGSDQAGDAQSLYFRLTPGEDGGGRVLRFQGRQDSTVIALTLAPDTTLAEQNIRIGDPLDFTRREGDRKVSTILDANIRLADFENKVIERGKGTFVSLGDLDEAEIRTIALKDGIEITLAGNVGLLSAGAEGDTKNLLPSRIETLHARNSWVLIAQLVVAVVTFLGGIAAVVGTVLEHRKARRVAF